jgi:hypothetical protein
MTDIDTLLKSVAPDAVRPDPEVVAADLARGRAALVRVRRRRMLRVSVGGASLAAAAAAMVLVATSAPTRAGSTSSHPSRGTPHAQVTRHPAPGHVKIAPQSAAKHAHGPRVELVDYSGAQLPGFMVSQIPEGWQLSTSTSTALLITPDDGTVNNDPDDFADKLAVLPQSVDEHGLGPGDPVTVNGQDGRVDHHSGLPGELQLRYTIPDGHAVDVQAPSSLHWTDDQIVAFAEGVQVTANVGTTHG